MTNGIEQASDHRTKHGAFFFTTSAPASQTTPYRILSLDGGGLCGLIPLVILERLDEAKPNWRNDINMFAGTSTGGLIALGLASGMSPRSLFDLYATRGKEIFARSLWHETESLGGLTGPKYDSTNRESVFHDVLKDTRLNDYISKDGTRGHVCVAAFDLKDAVNANQSTRDWKAKIFHNIPVAAGTNDGLELGYRVAMRTSAAPTYFGSYDGYVDGGVFANNPAMCALAQTLDDRLAIPIAPTAIRMLSLGTGFTATYFDDDENWGLAQWALRLVDLLTDGVLGVAGFQVQQLLGTSNYVRLTVPLGQKIAMDDPGMIGILRQLGSKIGISDALSLIQRW
jgi:predicted acylesterase/phospholipase RssA